MPLARSALAIAAASIESSKSMVPTTCERSSGLATKGCAKEDFSAQEYRIEEDSAVRATAQSRPPWPFSHSSWSASRKRVVMAGVLYVWSFEELSIAVGRSKNGGTYRPEPAISAARSSAAGEKVASQRPPSEAKDFCGAK